MYVAFRATYTSFKESLVSIAHFCYLILIKPRGPDEDTKRHEFILNTLLVGIIGILILLDLCILYSTFTVGNYSSISFTSFSLIVTAFIVLLLLSRAGYFIWTTYIFILLFFTASAYGSYTWGMGLPASLLSYALIITISSVLVSNRFSLMISFCIVIWLICLGSIESSSHTVPAWKHLPTRTEDAIQYSIILLFTVVTSWLSNRETEKSLARARKSENELKFERDSLEIKVEERTKELKQTQLDKIGQLYRFAEFGKLSSGIFHDLINPLTAISLNINQLSISKETKKVDTKECLNRAITASKRMESFIHAVRKQIQSQEIYTTFSLNFEINEALQILAYKARMAKVELLVKATCDVQMYGNPLYINRIITNLVSNSIDAYDTIPKDRDNRKVILRISEKDTIGTIEIRDYGCGISPFVLSKIFEPFFTTKPTDKGLGLGLSTTKIIVEKDLRGKIEVLSNIDKGSVFELSFPLIRKGNILHLQRD